MEIQHIDGCCALSNLHDLGTAHGHKTSLDQFDFNLRVEDAIKSSNTYVSCQTNQLQTREREYLNKLGFVSYPFPSGSGLEMHIGAKSHILAQIKLWKENEKEFKEKERQKKLDIVKSIKNSPFRCPKPPYTPDHLQELFDAFGLTVTLVKSYVNVDRVPLHYWYLCGSHTSISSIPLDKGLYEEYFEVSIDDSVIRNNVGFVYFEESYKQNPYVSKDQYNSSFLNWINRKLGYEK